MGKNEAAILDSCVDTNEKKKTGEDATMFDPLKGRPKPRSRPKSSSRRNLDADAVSTEEEVLFREQFESEPIQDTATTSHKEELYVKKQEKSLEDPPKATTESASDTNKGKSATDNAECKIDDTGDDAERGTREGVPTQPLIVEVLE